MEAQHARKSIIWYHITPKFFSFLSFLRGLQAWNSAQCTGTLQILRIIVGSRWESACVWICNTLIVCMSKSDPIFYFFIEVTPSFYFWEGWHLLCFCTLHCHWSWFDTNLRSVIFLSQRRWLFLDLTRDLVLTFYLLINDDWFWLIFYCGCRHNL